MNSNIGYRQFSVSPPKGNIAVYISFGKGRFDWYLFGVRNLSIKLSSKHSPSKV